MPHKLTFTIDGAALAGSPVPIVVRRACAALDKLADGKLLTRRSLSSALKVSEAHCNNFFAHPALHDYREKHTSQMLYANPRTIKQFRAQKAKL